MSVDRRRLLAAGLTAAGASLLVPGRAAAAAPQYPTNRAPLRPAPFIRLPPGAVRAQGWLATQLTRQLTDLCGQYAAREVHRRLRQRRAVRRRRHGGPPLVNCLIRDGELV